MKPLKTAVIGCGVIGGVHAACHELSPRAQLVCVCDEQAGRADELAETHRVRAVYDYREVLKDPGIEAVSLGLPPCRHIPVLADFVRAGKAVICEKPLGIDPDSLNHARRLAAESPVKTAGIFQHRFSPIIRFLREQVRGGAIGRVREADLQFRCNRDIPYYARDAWRGKWATEGGGITINQAIHSIDVLLFLLGGATRLSATAERCRREIPIEVEDRVMGKMILGEGVQTTLFLENRPEHGWESKVRLEGEAGRIEFNGAADHRVTAWESEASGFEEGLEAATAEEIRRSETKLPGKAAYGYEHLTQIDDFFTAIQEDREPFVSLADSAATNETVLGILHSAARGGESVSLPLTDYRHPVFGEE